jgi:hypothetical protein
MLVILCIWHSIIAAVIFYLETLEQLEPTNFYVLIDRYVFVSLFTIYIITHIASFVWLIHVPYKRRREMERFDREYRVRRCTQSSTQKKDLVFHRSTSAFDMVPNMKVPRAMRWSDGNIMIPNGSTFLPIQEISNEPTRKAIETIELHEPDDKY